MTKEQNSVINSLHALMIAQYGHGGFTPHTIHVINHKFYPVLGGFQLIENMERALSIVDVGPIDSYKYFCGICWGMIKEIDNEC